MKYFIPFLITFCFINCKDTAKVPEKTIFSQEKARVLQKAEEYFDQKPITVTATISERSTGGIHDFYSEGDTGGRIPRIPMALISVKME